MNPTTQNEVDEIDQAVFEFAVGREKTVPPHIRTALIESQPSVIKLKTAITKLIVDARLTELCETVESMNVPGLELVPRSAGQEVLDILLKRKKDLEAQLAELENQ